MSSYVFQLMNWHGPWVFDARSRKDNERSVVEVREFLVLLTKISPDVVAITMLCNRGT